MNGYSDESFKNDFKVSVSWQGEIQWEFGGPFRTRCKIDMDLYPYDSQKCSLIISLWHIYPNLRLHAEEPWFSQNQVDLTLFDTNLWQLKAVNFTDERPDLFNKANAIYTYTFKRKPLYYMVNIVLPLVILLAISFGVFWLPAESGEKVSLGITVLLAASVFQLILSDHTPVNSEVTPKISMWISFCF